MESELYVSASACKRGISAFDVQAVLVDPAWIMTMSELVEIGLGESDRPNVIVIGGFDLNGDKLVVFVDRFERIAFHSEPGSTRYGRLFP